MRIRIMSIIMVLLFAAGALFAEGTFANHPWGSSPQSVLNAKGYNTEQDQSFTDGSRQIKYLESVLGNTAMLAFVFENNELSSGLIAWSTQLYGVPNRERIVNAMTGKYGEPMEYNDFRAIINTDLILDPAQDQNAIDYAFWVVPDETVIAYAVVPTGILLLYYDFDTVALEVETDEDGDVVESTL